MTTSIETRNLIDGQWVEARGGSTRAVTDPADDALVAEVSYGGAAETEAAISAAERALPAWRALP
ncbi:MAG: aldehyde dehydrogenase family protein, partial [Myxococcales bacterium]|nr:aldehyde dehydrogenase family protein [Myxococcales bacterium]